jgi:hypothetical protein
MITKTQLINTIYGLPENLTVEQIIEHIIFVDNVQSGLQDSSNKNTFTKDEAKLKLSKWLK